MSDQFNHRISAFKSTGLSNEETRKKRVENAISLRKQRKEESLNKKRNIPLTNDKITSDSDPESTFEESKQPVPMKKLEEILPIILNPPSEEELLSAVSTIRKILSKHQNPPIDDVINAGLIPYLVTLLSHSNEKIQFEAAWAITNVVSGTSKQTQLIVDYGAVPILIEKLSSENSSISDQCVWALGNIAGDCPKFRDFVFNCGILSPLINLIYLGPSVGHLRNITWCLSNLVRNKNPYPPDACVLECLGTLSHLLFHQDAEIISDTCWAYSYITDTTKERIDWVLNSGVLGKLVTLLNHSQTNVITASLRTIGNIVTGSDEQTQSVIDSGALMHFPKLLQHSKSSLVKEACWVASNIAAGNKQQIQKLFDCSLVPTIISILKNGDFKSQKEAIWTISNITFGGHVSHIEELIKLKAVPKICYLLNLNDSKLVLLNLQCLASFLKVGKEIDCFELVQTEIEECGGLEKIEELQRHDNEEIYNQSIRIIEQFFSDSAVDDNDLQEIPTPEVGNENILEQDQNSYNFNF